MDKMDRSWISRGNFVLGELKMKESGWSTHELIAYKVKSFGSFCALINIWINTMMLYELIDMYTHHIIIHAIQIIIHYALYISEYV